VKGKLLFEPDENGELLWKSFTHFNGYFIATSDIFIELRGKVHSGYPRFMQGSKPEEEGF
jgi:hypothetical protein